MPQTILNIQGMHCHSCEVLIAEELKEQKEIQKVEVNQKTGQATITHEGDLDLKNIKALIKDLGYTVSA